MFIEFYDLPFEKPISKLSDVVESALNLFADVITKPVIHAYDKATTMAKFSKTKIKWENVGIFTFILIHIKIVFSRNVEEVKNKIKKIYRTFVSLNPKSLMILIIALCRCAPKGGSTDTLPNQP